MPETPFDSVESAQHYVALLIEAIDEAQRDLQTDIQTASGAAQPRRLEALHLVVHKLTLLDGHLHAATRILNDLRMLRRVLLGQTGEG